MFSYLIDLEVLSDFTEIYDALWSDYYHTIFKEQYDKLNYINCFQIGETHSLAGSTSGRIYSWGWNDHGQLGAPVFPETEKCSKDLIKLKNAAQEPSYLQQQQ